MEAPQFFETEMNPSDHFTVDDLLDISNDDDGDDDDDDRDALTGDDAVISGISPMINDPHVESCHSSHCTTPSLPFDEKLSVPYDDLADLEWLSNFVEDCFSGEDMEKLEVKASSMQSQWVSRSPQNSGQPSSQFVVGVPGKARSKRSRSALRSCWRSSPLTSSASSSADCGAACFDEKSSMISRVERVAAAGRKCLHCATDKTPQWRTGPMGPKTLCNACGVRYKSGRLVPEYRPAASPTFEQTKHSNSHRKVLELRRHKENERTQNQERHPCYDNLLFHDHHSTHRQLQLGTGLTWLT